MQSRVTFWDVNRVIADLTQDGNIHAHIIKHEKWRFDSMILTTRTYECRDKTVHCISTARFVYRGILGLFSLFFLSSFRNIHAAVSAQICIFQNDYCRTLSYANFDHHKITFVDIPKVLKF